MTKKIPHCKSCDRDGHYSIGCPYAFRKPIKVNKPLKRSVKPIKKKGKRTIEYEKWRDEVARPYLIEKYGEICVACQGARCGNQQLDVEHKKNRGSHHELKMVLSNVQLMGRYPCHYEKTNGINQVKEQL